MRNALLKKGSMTWIDYIAVLVLALLVIIIFARFLVVYKEGGTDATKKQICKESVMAYALSNGRQIKIAGSQIIDSLGNNAILKCITNYETIKENDAEKLKKKIASEMYDCYDQYLAGEYAIFEQAKNHYCVVCSDLKFETDKKQLTGMYEYLGETNIPGKEETFAEYFSHGSAIDTSSPGSQQLSQSTLDLSKDQAVIFLQIDNYKLSKLSGGIAGLLTGTAIGLGVAVFVIGTGGFGTLALVAVGGAAGGALGFGLGSYNENEVSSAVFLYPYDNLKDLDCTVLEGKTTELQIQTW